MVLRVFCANSGGTNPRAMPAASGLVDPANMQFSVRGDGCMRTRMSIAFIYNYY